MSKRLIETQLSDALAYMKALRDVVEGLPDEPGWGEGLRLILPEVIALRADYGGDQTPYAWLIANDFNGYDLTTSAPQPREQN